MLTQFEQAVVNLEEARTLRAAGTSYRDIRRRLGLSVAQLGHIRRALKREKAAGTRLRNATPGATARDLPVARSILPAGLRAMLTAAGYRTLGDIADHLTDVEAMLGIGPHKAQLVKRLLDHYGLLPESADLKAAIEALFPDLADDR